MSESTLSFDLLKKVVIDNGSGSCKAGFAGEKAPQTVVPTIIGKLKETPTINNNNNNNHQYNYVGNDVYMNRELLSIKYPIERGVVTNWDGVELLWSHIFTNELKVNYEETPVLLTEPPLNPKNHRERLVMTLFETFNTPLLNTAVSGLLALHASGRVSGVVFDSGAGVTHCIPVQEGRTVVSAIHELNVSGRTLTDYLRTKLEDPQRGYSFPKFREFEIVDSIKKTLCYTTLNYELEQQRHQATTTPTTTSNTTPTNEFKLPDGTAVRLQNESYTCAELYFKPYLAGFQEMSSSDLIDLSILKCDPSLHGAMYSNILLAGGSTLFSGFPERMQKEMEKLPSQKFNYKVDVVAPANRLYSAWEGGSILASMTSLQSTWMTKEDYEEIGPTLIYRKGFH